MNIEDYGPSVSLYILHSKKISISKMPFSIPIIFKALDKLTLKDSKQTSIAIHWNRRGGIYRPLYKINDKAWCTDLPIPYFQNMNKKLKKFLVPYRKTIITNSSEKVERIILTNVHK